MDSDNKQNPNTPVPNQDKAQDPSIRAIRTLEEDIRDAMQSKNMSAVKIAISESERRNGSKTISNSPTPTQQQTSARNIPPQRVVFTPAGQPMPTNLSGAPIIPASNVIPTVPNVDRDLQKNISNQRVSPTAPPPVPPPLNEVKNALNPENFSAVPGEQIRPIPSVQIPTPTMQNVPIRPNVGEFIQNKIEDRPVPRPQAQIVNTPPPLASDYQNSSRIPFNKIFLIIFSIIFIAGGLYGLYYLYTLLPKSVPIDNNGGKVEIFSIIPVEKNIKYIPNERATENTDQILKLLSAIEPGEKLVNIYFRTDDTLKSGSSDITPSEFFKYFDITVPNQLILNLQKDFMFGYYSDGSKNYPFLILKTGFFQGALSAMIKFEKDIKQELTPLFVDQSKITESGAPEMYSISRTFTDSLINNKDVRVLRRNDPNSTAVLLYSFIDQETLLITINEQAFKGILNSFEKRKFVR